VNREVAGCAAGCLGVPELNKEFVEAGAAFGVAELSDTSSTAGLGANNELVVDDFGVLALKREEVEND